MGSVDACSVMNRTSRSAVNRWHETRSVIQYGRPETTSIPSRQLAASRAARAIATTSE